MVNVQTDWRHAGTGAVSRNGINLVSSYKYARINIIPLLCEYEAAGTM